MIRTEDSGSRVLDGGNALLKISQAEAAKQADED
jgi:hypothetical protein